MEIGLNYLSEVGIELIHERVACLTGYLLEELSALRHDNGQPLVTIYGPISTEKRGGTISMNFFDPQHTIFDYRLIEALANHVNISLRTGCFCNPGAGEIAHHLTGPEMKKYFDDPDRMTFERLVVALTQQEGHDAIGALRVSLGIASNFADVHLFIQFARTFLNLKSAGILAE